MGKLVLLVAVVVGILLTSGYAKKCKEAYVKWYEGCLDHGFSSKIESCPKKTGDGVLGRKFLRKCATLEKYVVKRCDYNCVDAVDGGWSDYEDVSECTAECGGGTRVRSRTCTNPAPANGGAECAGDAAETVDCNTRECSGSGTCVGNTCYHGDSNYIALQFGESLNSDNGKFHAIMQGDGNLVVYCGEGDNSLWESGTYGSSIQGGLVFQADRNLVLYDHEADVIWASNTDGDQGSRLVMQDDGNLVLYSEDGTAVWATDTNLDGAGCPGTCLGNTCYSGNLNYIALKIGESLYSDNGKYHVIMQEDGDLVVYCDGNHRIWASHTNGFNVGGGLVFQADQNLVIYDSEAEVIWASNTDSDQGSKLVMQDDGNLVLYSEDNNDIWATDTNDQC